MDMDKGFEFRKKNKGKIFIACDTCCILKCGVFGDFKKQCHCGNFENTECEKCKNKNQTF